MTDDAPDSSRETSKPISSVKDAISVAREAALLLLGVLLLLWPETLKATLVRAGFQEGTIAGFTWKAQLVDSNQTLHDAQETISDLKAQNDKLTAALTTAHDELDANAGLKARIENLVSENTQLKSSASAVQDSMRSTIASNSNLVEQVAPSSATIAWGIVFGGDRDLDGAKHEVEVTAPKQGLTSAHIYLRQGWYRSVVISSDQAVARQLLEKAKLVRPDSYLVNLGTWCPAPVDKDGYLQCS